jgi:isopenicillin N synthase-like dioxygenase
MNGQTPLFLQIPLTDGAKCLAREAADGWREFCNMPTNMKQLFSIGDEDPVCDDGYRMRNNPGEDPKEFFHVTHALLPELYDRFRRCERNHPRVRTMLAMADALLVEANEMAYQYTEHLKRNAPGCENLTRDIFAHGHTATLRFLHYLPGTKSDILAMPHIDKGGPTLHLYESDTGLEYLDQGKSWRELPLGGDLTVCFGGLTQQYVSGVPALCHRVIATARTEAEGRFSIVCFTELPLEPKIKRGIRLSQFSAGFNYNMSKSELSDLFDV